jgi:hypothetical protein
MHFSNWTSRHFFRKFLVSQDQFFLPGKVSRMAAKPVDPDRSILHHLADHAHKLLQEYVSLPSDELERAAELTTEFEHVIAEFKRLRPAPLFKRRRDLRLAPKLTTRLCSICEQPVNLEYDDFFQTEGAIYHHSCYVNAVGS